MTERASTFVLVHGAWHGGWCWKKVAPRLAEAGHVVVTPTLTGLGERQHLLSREIGLQTHVEDVVGVLEMEDLTDVTLVGHSNGGMVIRGVSARVPARIRRLVYLDAAVPEDGQCEFDLLPPEARERFEAAAAAHGDGYKVPPIVQALGVSDPLDLAWLTPRLRPHPLAAFRDPVHAPAAPLPSSYIVCEQFVFREVAARLRAKGWPVAAIDCGHDAMIIKPRELVEILTAEGG